MNHVCPDCGGRLDATLECVECGHRFYYAVNLLRRIDDKAILESGTEAQVS